jgi:hypothetical protein
MSGCRRFRGGLIGPGIGLSLDGLRVLWLPHLADSSPEVLFGTLSTDRAEKLSLGLVCHVVVLHS